MHITIFGASGNMGQRITGEAISRGHTVVAAMRSQAPANCFPTSVSIKRVDASKLNEVLELVSNTDLIISATRPASGQEMQLADTTKVLLDASAQTQKRIIFSGGAATLVVPNSNGRLVLDDRDYLSEPYLPIARACAEQHALCLNNKNAPWTYLSPAALLYPGQRTGIFRLGLDELLVNENGESGISMEDMAVALLDEAEKPKHLRQRFTVAY